MNVLFLFFRLGFLDEIRITLEIDIQYLESGEQEISKGE